MPTLKIDNHDHDTLSIEARAQLQSLPAALPSRLEQAQASETMKFN